VELVIVLVLVAVVAVVVMAPLRPGRPGAREAEESAEHAELAAARDAKYREIRDAELDYRTGKLSEADWRVQDRALRGEAIELLRRLDRLEGREGGD
jgi:type II secretory pathway pseudopilin PulG